MAEMRRTTDVVVHCAGRMGEQPVPILRIVAETEIDDKEGGRMYFDGTLLEFYQKEARTLAEAIFQHLPGGTVDQLIVALFERRASLLRVKF